MPTDLEAALSAAVDERDLLHDELGQAVRDLAGHSDPVVARVVERASRALEIVAPHDEKSVN